MSENKHELKLKFQPLLKLLYKPKYKDKNLKLKKST